VNAARTTDGYTALMIASEKGNLVIAQLLVEGGANVNAARTDDGWTALMRAAKKGHLEIARFLLNSGADKAALSHAGRTAHSLCAAHPAIRALLA
jgi:ankyrin repeat protein